MGPYVSRLAMMTSRPEKEIGSKCCCRRQIARFGRKALLLSGFMSATTWKAVMVAASGLSQAQVHVQV